MIYYTGFLIVSLCLYNSKIFTDIKSNVTNIVSSYKQKYLELNNIIRKSYIKQPNNEINIEINKETKSYIKKDLYIDIKVQIVTFKFIIKYLLITIYNKMYEYCLLIYNINNVKRIDNKTYEITYYINKQKYILITKVKGGPNPINNITDENNKDITSRVLPYLGPGMDLYRGTVKKLTPKYLNTKQIYFNLNDDISPIYFNEHDHIYLNL
jgi:hypothetical protein